MQSLSELSYPNQSPSYDKIETILSLKRFRAKKNLDDCVLSRKVV